MKNQNTHALLLALVGGYVLYIAYQLLDGLLSGKGDMPQAAAIAAIAVFALGGAGVLLYALKVWRDAGKKEEEPADDPDKLN